MKSSEQEKMEVRVLHLHAIMIASDLIKFETNYLVHIVRSFKNNYKVDLCDHMMSFNEVVSPN